MDGSIMSTNNVTVNELTYSVCLFRDVSAIYSLHFSYTPIFYQSRVRYFLKAIKPRLLTQECYTTFNVNHNSGNN